LGNFAFQFIAFIHSLIASSASGFIGFPVAQALTRAGHHVTGLVRSQTKAKQLAAEESTFMPVDHASVPF
jgi:nucleoside-diphosphate-sugar epimerase